MRRLLRAPLPHRAAPSGPALSGPPYAVALRSVGGLFIAAPGGAASPQAPLRLGPRLRGGSRIRYRILFLGGGSPASAALRLRLRGLRPPPAAALRRRLPAPPPGGLPGCIVCAPHPSRRRPMVPTIRPGPARCAGPGLLWLAGRRQARPSAAVCPPLHPRPPPQKKGAASSAAQKAVKADHYTTRQAAASRSGPIGTAHG